MRRAVLLLALLLPACAPALQTLQGDGGTLTAAGQVVTLANPGPGSITKVAVYLAGRLTVQGAACHAVRSGTGCALPDVPAGGTAALTVTEGRVTTGSVTYYRTGSTRPRLVLLTKP